MESWLWLPPSFTTGDPATAGGALGGSHNTVSLAFNALEDGLAAIDDLVAEGLVDARRVGVYGSSYGRFMTNLALAQSDRFAAGVSGATIPEYYATHSPLTYVADITAPFAHFAVAKRTAAARSPRRISCSARCASSGGRWSWCGTRRIACLRAHRSADSPP